MSNLKVSSLIIIFSVLSCSEPSINNNFQQTVNQDTIETVHYELKDSSIIKMPYKGKTKVIFVDAQSNYLEFTIQEKELETHSESSYNEQLNKCEPPSWTTQNKEIKLINDSLNLIFLLELKTDLDDSGSYEKTFRDLLILWTVSYPDKDKKNNSTLDTDNVRESRKALFQWVVDRRTSIYESNRTSVDSLLIEGQTFYDVIEQNPNRQGNQLSIKFNFEYGIISFRDFERKQWRFSHFSD